MIGDDKHTTILETTLRDGNYLVDFQFTAEDTAWLAARLEACGIDYIEIGHGLGLGASTVYKAAAATDEAYVKAARNALTRAKFGMFAIPGVASSEDIAMAADNGMDFIRIGANVDRARDMEPLIGEARRRGLFVSTNFMKSYCMAPEAFGKIGAMAEEFGSQLNYVVDSAGGMLPTDIRDYFQALHACTSVPSGFHGHDNIRLAIANSLVALESGAVLVDTTLFGIGRDSGNAATELMVAILKQRFNQLDHIDETELIRLAESEAVPLLRHRSQETVSMSLGLAQVHSMYLSCISEYAHAHDIDIHSLISEVGQINRLDLDDDVLILAAQRASGSHPVRSEFREGVLSLSLDGSREERMAQAQNLARKLGVPCRIWIVSLNDEPRLHVSAGAATIDVVIEGDPRSSLMAARDSLCEILVTPELKSDLPALKKMAGKIPLKLIELPAIPTREKVAGQSYQ